MWNKLKDLGVVVRRVQWVAEYDGCEKPMSVDLVVEFEGVRFLVEMKTGVEKGVRQLMRLYAQPAASNFVWLKDFNGTWKGTDRGTLDKGVLICGGKLVKAPLPALDHPTDEGPMPMGIGALVLYRDTWTTEFGLCLQEFTGKKKDGISTVYKDPSLDVEERLEHVATDEEVTGWLFMPSLRQRWLVAVLAAALFASVIASLSSPYAAERVRVTAFISSCSPGLMCVSAPFVLKTRLNAHR